MSSGKIFLAKKSIILLFHRQWMALHPCSVDSSCFDIKILTGHFFFQFANSPKTLQQPSKLLFDNQRSMNAKSSNYPRKRIGRAWIYRAIVFSRLQAHADVRVYRVCSQRVRAFRRNRGKWDTKQFFSFLCLSFTDTFARRSDWQRNSKPLWASLMPVRLWQVATRQVSRETQPKLEPFYDLINAWHLTQFVWILVNMIILCIFREISVHWNDSGVSSSRRQRSAKEASQKRKLLAKVDPTSSRWFEPTMQLQKIFNPTIKTEHLVNGQLLIVNLTWKNLGTDSNNAFCSALQNRSRAKLQLPYPKQQIEWALYTCRCTHEYEAARMTRKTWLDLAVWISARWCTSVVNRTLGG